ncbi:Signal transduction histidine kinase CheA [Labilithrix luteola]|uniref:Signal transduction histidine kinase CheA n=1 Tax=Labilithrix luteola TaxID=1391654 RepID=A0A0K1PLI4_9BACT|nr:ATP-binding protein [Labilithrix luteola]AKU94385.1 Signal transduction histidine kinase CheA [Labilithrix luteola]
MRALLSFLVLPKTISAFEARHLRRTNRLALAFFALHVPVLMGVAWMNGTRPWLALVLALAVFAGPLVACVSLSNPRSISVVHGMAAMFFGGLLVHFGQGPIQTEMHFYFFSLIAILAIFGNPIVIVAAALTVTLHHLALWFLVPRSVFNYDAPVWVVAVHAMFVVLESAAGCHIARSFFDGVTGLERLVQTLRRNQDLRLLLDNVDQGFATIDRHGILSVERSRAFDRWFPDAPDTIFVALGSLAPDFAIRTQLSWEALVDGILPLELLLDQMPKRFATAETHFDVTYVPIESVAGESPEKFLVVITDVTAEVRREVSEREWREVLHLFERLTSDRSAVQEYFEEANALVAVITGGEELDRTTLGRKLHTLKGNSAIFGFETIANICHDLESTVADGRQPTATELVRLSDRWMVVTSSLERFGTRRRIIELEEHQQAELEEEARLTSPWLLPRIRDLRLEPTRRRLDLFAEQAKRIAERLGKEVDVEIEDHGLRLDPRRWAPVWGALVHAVRNAIDHGIESPYERAVAGKNPRGRLVLRTMLEAERFVIQIEDDGRGIDWKAVEARAIQLGITPSSKASLEAALFRGGLSTASETTELSGRGMGMGALLDATKLAGGVLSVDSEVGHGTRLRLIFDQASMVLDVSPLAERASRSPAAA